MVLEDDLSKRSESADELRSRAADAPRSDEIDVTDVISDAFVAANTSFDTFDELVAASPADAETAAELGAVPRGSWDAFIAEHTVFADETEFVIEARDHWVGEQLNITA